MQRREFIKTSCSFCLAASAGLFVTTFNSCSSLPTLDADIVDHRITVPLSVFADSDLQILRPRGLLFDIGVHRESDGSYRALVLECTHASTQLTPTGDGYNCPQHGSRFDIEGKVLRGPAQIALRQLPTEVSSASVVVHLR